jgi:hypothetical protein
MFDGKTVRVLDWEAVWTRTVRVDAREYRRLPYYNCGDGNGEYIVGRLVDRCAKYEARGFSVITRIADTEAGIKMLNEEILRQRQLEMAYIGFYEVVPMRTLFPHHQQAYRTWIVGVRTGSRIPWEVEMKRADERLERTEAIADIDMIGSNIQEWRDERATYYDMQARYHAKRRCRRRRHQKHPRDSTHRR